MTQTSWPFENIDTSETQFSQWAKALQGSGYGGVSGVPGDSTLKVTAAASGLTLNVSAGFAVVRGFAYNNDAVASVNLNSVSANRYDRIILRLDPVANSVILAVVTGTGATTPTLPTLAQTDSGTYELELGYIYLPAGTTNAITGTITDVRPFLGEQVGKWTTATRPAPYLGRTGFNTTSGYLETWNGTTWTAAGSSAPSPLMLMGA